MEQQWTNARKQEQTNSPDPNASEPLPADYPAWQSANASGSSQSQMPAQPEDAPPAASRGWAMWVALILILLGMLIAAAA